MKGGDLARRRGDPAIAILRQAKHAITNGPVVERNRVPPCPNDSFSESFQEIAFRYRRKEPRSSEQSQKIVTAFRDSLPRHSLGRDEMRFSRNDGSLEQILQRQGGEQEVGLEKPYEIGKEIFSPKMLAYDQLCRFRLPCLED